MTSSPKARPPGELDLPAPAAYEVGYGKPPVQHRFSKDNPGKWEKGPRKRRSVIADGVAMTKASSISVDDVVIDIANQLVKVRTAKGLQTMPSAKALVQTLMNTGLGGSRLAACDFLRLFHGAETRRDTLNHEMFKSFYDYKENAERDLENCILNGLPIDGILPHPADICIELNTGQVRMHGPMDEKQRAACEPHRIQRDNIQIDVSYASQRHRNARGAEAKAYALSFWHASQSNWDWHNDRLPKSLKVELENRSLALGASTPGSTLPDTEPRRRKGKRT